MFVNHRTDCVSNCVEKMITTMFHTRTRNIISLWVCFSCMHLRSYDLRDENDAVKDCSESCRREAIRNVCKLLLVFNLPQLETLGIGKTTDSTRDNTRNRERRLWRDDAEEKYIIIVLKVSIKRF